MELPNVAVEMKMSAMPELITEPTVGCNCISDVYYLIFHRYEYPEDFLRQSCYQ
jgi:hypothetical protein